jgi:dihydroorotate dehydrogenase electron transfer subunit
MMKERTAEVISSRALSADIFKLILRAPEIAGGVQAGQFVQLEVPGFSLRRPFTVADADTETITLVIRRQGRGTNILEKVLPGQKLQILGPLGQKYCPQPGPALLLGGGIGAAALTLLARRLPNCTFVMGGRSENELWLESLDLPETVKIEYATDDGSRGFHGNLVRYAQKNLEAGMWVGACGPEPMLAGLQQLLLERGISGEFALEERIACGIGACMGCTCRTKTGRSLVCKDGPVFNAREVLFR